VSAAPVGQLLSGLTAIQQLLASPAALSQALSGPAGLQQLLSGLAPIEATAPAPVPSSEQNAVDQTAYQVQTGGPGTVAQVQSASQINTTIQSWLSPVSALDGTSSGDPVGEAVNQAVQSTWQLQIGCVFYCVRTQQAQQASESDTLISSGGGGSGSASPVINSAVMRVWQLQIGCLFWCYDTVEVQSAVLSATAITVPAAVTPPANPASGTGSPGSAGATPAGPSPAGGGAAPAPVDARSPSSLSPELTQSPGQNLISSPPVSQNRISSGPPASTLGDEPSSLVRGVTVEPVQAGAVALRPPHGVVEVTVLPRPETAVATGKAAQGGATSRATTVSASHAGSRPDVPPPTVTVVSPHVRERAFRAGGDISPSPLLLVLGGVVCLFLVGFLISSSRGMTPRM
jgi:hypothetical protein